MRFLAIRARYSARTAPSRYRCRSVPAAPEGPALDNVPFCLSGGGPETDVALAAVFFVSRQTRREGRDLRPSAPGKITNRST